MVDYSKWDKFRYSDDDDDDDDDQIGRRNTPKVTRLGNIPQNSIIHFPPFNYV